MPNEIQTKHLEDVIINHGQDLSGKVIAITGTTTGTGYVCAREVAKKGAHVILLNRKSEKSTKEPARLAEMERIDVIRKPIDIKTIP